MVGCFVYYVGFMSIMCVLKACFESFLVRLSSRQGKDGQAFVYCDGLMLILGF